MGVGGTIGTAGKGFRGPKGAKMALHMGMHISRPSVGSEQMLLLSRKTHSILPPAIHLYPAKWNQVSLLIVGPTRLRRTIRQGSFLSKLAEEQKHIRVQQYHYAAEKSVKKKGRMSVSIGSIVTLGAVIRFKFPLIVPKRFLGQLSSICCLTLLSSHSQAAKEVSRYPYAVKKQQIATVYSDTSNTKTAKSETIKATEKLLQDEKLPRSSGSVVDQSFSLAEKDREILKGSHSLQEDSNRDRLAQESCVIDKISDSSSKFGSLSGKITRAPVEDDGGLTDGTVSCSACTAPEPKSEVTIIAFDIETTGLKLSDDRIIEFAARDLAGGKCSTLQTLVNPGQKVPYSVTLVHGIKDEMVNRTDVPSWREVAIAILQFVEIRRKGGPVILVAHNGKRFDVPFIMKEFHDCSMEVPSWWYFVDSLSLAREVMKANGSKFTTLKLSSLHEYYGLPSQGRAHRAMADVHMLASVFGMLMKDLQLPVSGLLERAFKAEDIILKIVKTGVPLPSVDHLQEKLQEELQSLSLTDEDDAACSNVEDDDDLIEVNVARLNESGNDASVPWEDSQMDNLDKEITGKDYLQLVQGISENVEVNESGFSVEGEKSLSLSTYPQVDRKLQPLIISHMIQTEDKHQNKSMDLPNMQPDEMALFLDSENVDSDPVCTGMRQLEGGSMNIWTETEIKVLTSISESSTDVDSPLEKALLFDNVKIAGADRANISKCFIKSLSASNEWALHTSSVDTSLLSPMMKQHVETKRQRPEFLLLSRVGDFYEAFFEDAEVLAMACNLKVGAVDGGKLLERRVPMTGVPHHKIDFYLRMLLSKGITVVKQDQVTLEGKNGALLGRQVTAVLTPGTLLDDAMLEDSCNNYLVSVVPPCDDNDIWGLAYADISTGEFHATQSEGKKCLVQEILRLQPSEVIVPSNVTGIDSESLDLVQPIGLPTYMCYSCRPLSDFSVGHAEKDLIDFLGVDTLESVGLSEHPLAIRAAGALLRYVQETQGITIEELPLRKLCCYSVKDALHIDDIAKSHLELIKTARWGKSEGSLIWAMGYTMTAMGSRMLRKWILWPLLKHEDITLRHDAVEFLANNKGLRSRLRTLIASLGDLERLIGRTAWMRAEARDLLSLAQAILELPRLSTILAMMPVNKYFSGAATIPMPAVDLAKKVQNFIVSKLASRPKEGMLVKDGVDESLDSLRIQIAELESWMNNFAKREQIRTGLSSLEVGYSRPLGRYISIKKGKLKDQSIPENYQKLQTLKNEERFVTSELLGNERKRLDVISKACEREEEILDMLREEMAKISKSLQYLCQAIAALDVLSTFAELAVQRNYVRPEIMESGSELTIVSGRHPVVELILTEQSMFIPNSTYLGFNPFEPMANESSSDNLTESDSRSKEKDKKFWPRSDLILLTGPNSSGKSCYLRQVGLIQILAQAGSFVPAKRARMSIADAVFTQVGAVDDLSAGQSAFNVEMVESANILKCATSKSLVLLDEVGRGAGSHEGEAFARAIIEYLSQHIKARTIFSTYYHNLHHIDIEFPNISNYHFEAHETETGSIMFEYILRPGFALQSYTVALGRVAGLPEWVCNRAAELLTSKDDHSSTWGSDDPVTGLRNVENINEVACPDKAASINPKEPESMQMIGISNSNSSTAASNIADQAFNWRSWLRRKWKGVEKNGTISLAGQSSTIDDHVAGNFEHDAGLEISFSIEELKETWENVLKVLQNRPATLALAKQKGSILAILKFSDAIHVKLGASELFVKKFEQHEHAIAMEAAFKTVLKQPVKLQICTISTVED